MMMNNLIPVEISDSDYSDIIVDRLISEYDEKNEPLPDIEFQPHLLISKVRKHYMEHLIKLLSTNYENNQKLLNKNIYLPSAIWRCAKNIEMAAAQASMVVQLYRKNIIMVIQEVKNDTKKGKLNKKLYDCLRKPPENEKKTQTSYRQTDCSCQCTCNQRKRRKMVNELYTKTELSTNTTNYLNTEPLLKNDNLKLDKIDQAENTESVDKLPINSNVRMSIESHESDELMIQLEKLFQSDPNDEDLFEDSGLCGHQETNILDENTIQRVNSINCINQQNISDLQENVTDNSNQIKSLDDRLASLAGILVSNDDCKLTQEKQGNEKLRRQHSSSKWLCEEYFLKTRLFELLDSVRDCNRKKLSRIKTLLVDLFGDDSDDEGVVSPLDETPEFVISCKERIAPWVVKMLTPYYIKGRIRGKALFKSLAKHLIRLIYQCSKYPQEYEVHSFVSDFLENHKMIRCEADYKQFRIENI